MHAGFIYALAAISNVHGISPILKLRCTYYSFIRFEFWPLQNRMCIYKLSIIASIILLRVSALLTNSSYNHAIIKRTSQQPCKVIIEILRMVLNWAPLIGHTWKRSNFNLPPLSLYYFHAAPLVFAYSWWLNASSIKEFGLTFTSNF